MKPSPLQGISLMDSNASTLHVLVVDDDEDTRANLGDILELDGHRVDTAGTAAEVMERDDWSSYSAIILDRKLPDGTAEELLPRLREAAPEASVLVVTGYADLHGAIAALRQGAADYILKPINAEALRASLLRVADRRRLAMEKERSEAAFRTLIEAAPCMIVILRPDHRLAYFSRFAESLTGYTAPEVLGHDFFETFLPEEHRQRGSDGLRNILAGTPIEGIERPVRCKDGTIRWVLWNTRRLTDHEGEPAVLAIGQDITDLKQAQDRTLQAERLAAIGQMMAGLAHESGNALQRSQACLEMLALDVQDRPDALNLVSRIQNAQNHLQQLYDEVRNYAAPLKLERQTASVAGTWRLAWANLSMLRQGRQTSLREQCEGVEVRCCIDPFRLEQIFRNILENALAACRDPVEIVVQCSETTLSGQPALRVAVRDNGPGLSTEQQKRIFEPFFTTKTKGTGLGMAIAKRIVEAHGGQLSVGNVSLGCAPAAVHGAEIVIILPRTNP
jgi:PAS domain S-box-containing protein